ncbi:hypothetical protein FOZ62_012350, partial [Perkinsus olseni]
PPKTSWVAKKTAAITNCPYKGSSAECKARKFLFGGPGSSRWLECTCSYHRIIKPNESHSSKVQSHRDSAEPLQNQTQEKDEQSSIDVELVKPASSGSIEPEKSSRDLRLGLTESSSKLRPVLIDTETMNRLKVGELRGIGRARAF